MKEIKLEQGSPEWLAWRKTVITATDASIILGNNPWDTPYTCWQRKLGLIEEKVSNEAMERGKRLEPDARDQFNGIWFKNMQPMVVESSEYDFLGASLDGISDDGKNILEIKCGGSKLHSMASRGEIPAYYKDQMQHQLLVTGADKCFYYSYDGRDGICIEVYPDPEYAKTFLPLARAFWKCVALGEPPALMDSDYKDMSDRPDWFLLATEYRKVNEEIKALEEVKEAKRKELLALCGDQSCRGGGVRVMKTFMRGRVSYDDIPELKVVDLDKYRKQATTTWKIMVA